MQRIIIQLAIHPRYAPKIKSLQLWAVNALRKKNTGEMTIRIVGKKEMTQLNGYYRGKQKPTNVLSFPCSVKLPIKVLGDIAICAPVVNKEAREQNKSREAHWAHMITHGVLHLLGYDHEKTRDAKVMETLEIKLLKRLGFQNPYYLQEKNLTHEL